MNSFQEKVAKHHKNSERLQSSHEDHQAEQQRESAVIRISQICRVGMYKKC